MGVSPDNSNLKRLIQHMPDDVLHVLRYKDLLGDYAARPAYQRNDYLAWISRAKLPATRYKRIRQMVQELQQGGLYMGMDHFKSRKP